MYIIKIKINRRFKTSLERINALKMKIWQKLCHNTINGLGINKKHPIERKTQNTYIIFYSL